MPGGRLETLDIHGGITDDDIISHLEKALRGGAVQALLLTTLTRVPSLENGPVAEDNTNRLSDS